MENQWLREEYDPVNRINNNNNYNYNNNNYNNNNNKNNNFYVFFFCIFIWKSKLEFMDTSQHLQTRIWFSLTSR